MSPLERARDAVGARFRLHGRAVDTGLDCVGLAALAYRVEVPRGYALRSGDAGVVVRAVAAAGLVVAAEPRPGDLLLFRTAAGQLHLAIDSGGGVIHADAVLRKVVERPGVPPWTAIGRWRRED